MIKCKDCNGHGRKINISHQDAMCMWLTPEECAKCGGRGEIAEQTWVLILNPNSSDSHPAIIGGYRSRAEAEDAGRAATEMQKIHDHAHPNGYTYHPNWINFQVIPGGGA